MSAISIKIDGVRSLSCDIRKYNSDLVTARTGVASLRYSIDSKILSRRNINARISTVCNSISNLEAKLKHLEVFMDNAMDRYSSAEKNINNKALSIGLLGQKSMGGNWDAFDSLTSNSNKNEPFKVSKITEDLGLGTEYTGYLLDTGTALLSIKKTLGSGFKIIRDGDYYIIKGNINFRKNIAKIPGSRYKIGSPKFNLTLAKYVNPDLSLKTFAKNVGPAVKGSFAGTLKGAFVFEKNINAGKAMGNIGRGLGYASAAVGVIGGISENIENGETEATKYGADATVDLAKGLGAMAVATAGMNVGAAIGTCIPIPVVGTVVGAVAGFAIGFIATSAYNYVVDDLKINGKSVSEYAKEGTKYALDKAVDVGKDVYTGASNIAKDVSSKITISLDEAANNVGDFFNGAGEAFGGLFG